MQHVPECFQCAREHDDLHGAGQILYAGIGHHAVGLCRHHFAFDNGADDADMAIVRHIGILTDQSFDGVGGKLSRLLPVGIQRMTGKVQAADLFLLLEQLGVGILRAGLDLIAVGGRRIVHAAHHREEVDLTIQILPAVTLDALEHTLSCFDQTAAVGAKIIKGTGLDEAFHSAAVQLGTMHPFAEIVQAGIRLFLPLLYGALDQPGADIFYGVQAKPDPTTVLCSKAAARDIDIRRQDLDSQSGALAGILDDLACVVQDTGQQRSHKLAGVMALEVGCLECHIGITGGMTLVEGVGCKAGHLIVNFVCNLFRDTVCHTARALVAGVCAAVDKMFPLRLHHSVFLLAHGTADIICLPERKARQLPEDLHDLFLIDDTAIGHIQNVGQLRGLIADFVRFMAVAQVGRDGIHRAGAVQADQSDDIFQILRLQAHQHLLHT